jgi:hypothetical protein
MAIDKAIANQVLSHLDSSAKKLEGLVKDGKLDAKVASEMILKIDTFADKFQVAAFGEENLRKFQAKVLKQDSDEPYMKTFDNPNKPLQVEADEPYMKKVDKTFSGGPIDTYDNDNSSGVSERKEPQVRDLSPLSSAKKQPSQPSYGGKSTHQGSQAPAKTWAPRRVVAKKTEKTWAP